MNQRTVKMLRAFAGRTGAEGWKIRWPTMTPEEKWATRFMMLSAIAARRKERKEFLGRK